MRHSHIHRIAVSAIALSSLLYCGCSGSDSIVGNGAGNVRFVLGGGSTQPAVTGTTAALSDGTGRTIESAEISLSSILARNLDGQLIDVTVDLPFAVDLVGLIQGGTVELPIGSLPVGSYDQLVIVIRSLHVVLSDGTQIDVTPPGGGWTVIVRTEPFDVADGVVTTVNLRFRADGAFHWADGHLDFNPGFDCDVDDHRGDDDDED